MNTSLLQVCGFPVVQVITAVVGAVPTTDVFDSAVCSQLTQGWIWSVWLELYVCSSLCLECSLLTTLILMRKAVSQAQL